MERRMRGRDTFVLVVFALVCGAVVFALGGVARATYPGTNNGRVAFAMSVNGNVDIYSALPNGNDLRRLTATRALTPARRTRRAARRSPFAATGAAPSRSGR